MRHRLTAELDMLKDVSGTFVSTGTACVFKFMHIFSTLLNWCAVQNGHAILLSDGKLLIIALALCILVLLILQTHIYLLRCFIQQSEVALFLSNVFTPQKRFVLPVLFALARSELYNQHSLWIATGLADLGTMTAVVFSHGGTVLEQLLQCIRNKQAFLQHQECSRSSFQLFFFPPFTDIFIVAMARKSYC